MFKFSHSLIFDRYTPSNPAGLPPKAYLTVNDNDGEDVFFACTYCSAKNHNGALIPMFICYVNQKDISEGIKRREFFLIKHTCPKTGYCNRVRITEE